MLGIECTVRNAKGYTVRLRCTQQKRETTAEALEEKGLPQPATFQTCEWEGTWGEERTLLLPRLMTTS